MLLYILLLLVFSSKVVLSGDKEPTIEFPADFSFGVSSSSYQIEGSWNADHKGEHIWDRYVHTHPESIQDGKNGDVACDSYNKYKEDIKNLKRLGVNTYRMSISWSRILPNGTKDYINHVGITYYKKLFKNLKKNGIEPLVTLFHWDLPIALYDLGWSNVKLADYFVDYARIVFENFGDQVHYWTTFNEPLHFCAAEFGQLPKQKPVSQLHDSMLAQFMSDGVQNHSISNGVGAYQCGYTVLIAHARVYHMYQTEFKKKFAGKIGISLNSLWCQPKNSNETEAQQRCLEMEIGWFAHPIFSETGNYPKYMIDRIANLSQSQQFNETRLPALNESEVQLIKNSADFLGLNYYFGRIVSRAEHGLQYKPLFKPDLSKIKPDLSKIKPDLSKNKNKNIDGALSGFGDFGPNALEQLLDMYTPDIVDSLWLEIPSLLSDVGIIEEVDPSWKQNADVPWLQNYPAGLYSLLMYIKDKYKNPLVLITENGWSERSLEDDDRIDYIKGHLEMASKAIRDGSNLKAYIAWSLMDSFEWKSGYTRKFGFFSVNFTDPDLPRVPRKSVGWFRNIIDEHRQRNNLTGTL